MESLYEGWEETSDFENDSEETIEEGECNCGECPKCKEDKEMMNESKDVVYDLTFLKEDK